MTAIGSDSTCISVLRLVVEAVILLVCIGPQCATPQDLTIKGPESKDIAPRITGYVISTKSRSDLVALSLPEMNETLVRRTAAPSAELYPTIHAISGPDSSGRILYVEDHFFVANDAERKHILKTIQVDGKRENDVFTRPGSAMWAATRAGRGEIGNHLALAPSGGKAALLSGLAERQMKKALLHEGNIEIWDVEKKQKFDVATKAIDQPMSWFPDGKRLAYSKLVPRDELPAEAIGLAEFGTYFGESWPEVPAIFVLDLERGKSSFLHVGWTPIVAYDGNDVLIGGWDSHARFSWRRFVVESQKSITIKWPGDAGGAVSMPYENVVLYKGLPTAGAPLKFTENNSELRGEKLMLTLKVARINSEDFQTIVPEFDARDLVSFGRVITRD